MLGFVLFGLLASAHAAPHYLDDDKLHDSFFADDVFDTARFWTKFSREMSKLDKMKNEFTKHFSIGVSSEGVDTETNEYKVTIPLTGFEKKDVAVKVRKGYLMVEAIKERDGDISNSYRDIRRLPDYVSTNGSWTYNKGVLKIVFPLLDSEEDREFMTKKISNREHGETTTNAIDLKD